MNYRPVTFLAFLLFVGIHVLNAQKPFVEGHIEYNVTITSADERGNTKEYKGSYTITIKGKQIRKELRMKNGYDDILIFNFDNNTAYSLKTLGDKKYAIQLSIEDLARKAKKYEGFSLKKDEQEKKIAGLSAYKADINYRDGNTSVIFLTDEWQPDNKLTFERFPDCKFLPLVFDYTNENGSRLHFQAEDVDATPVENSDFRIPADFKLISYNEYQQLSR